MSSVELRSEVSGNVWKVLVNEGDRVSAGDELVIVESMKMEIPVTATDDGVVQAVLIEEGASVEDGQAVVRLAVGAI